MPVAFGTTAYPTLQQFLCSSGPLKGWLIAFDVEPIGPTGLWNINLKAQIFDGTWLATGPMPGFFQEVQESQMADLPTFQAGLLTAANEAFSGAAVPQVPGLIPTGVAELSGLYVSSLNNWPPEEMVFPGWVRMLFDSVRALVITDEKIIQVPWALQQDADDYEAQAIAGALTQTSYGVLVARRNPAILAASADEVLAIQIRYYRSLVGTGAADFVTILNHQDASYIPTLPA